MAKAAEAQRVSRTTIDKWLRRYQAEGEAGLEDRSSRPRRSPRLIPPELVQAILAARVERRWGPHRIGPLVGVAPSTVYAVLNRTGFSRVCDADGLSGVPVRYVEVKLVDDADRVEVADTPLWRRDHLVRWDDRQGWSRKRRGVVECPRGREPSPNAAPKVVSAD